MPLLEIIGITSFNTSFCSYFVFLRKEGYEEYEWALSVFKKVLGPDYVPSVIVTNRELALMKDVKVVFPTTANLLCVWYIQKYILANCKPRFEKKEDLNTFVLDWNNEIFSPNEGSSNKAWHDIEYNYWGKCEIISYIKRTWIPYKEYFVNVWTEKFLHFRNRVTSRAEGTHSKLKKYLLLSTGDIRTVKDKMYLHISNEVQEIKTQLESEKVHVLSMCKESFFKEVVTKVSFFSMKEMAVQLEKVKNSSMSVIYTVRFSSTMGFPCAHLMWDWKTKSLTFENIHPQWRIDMSASLFNFKMENREKEINEVFLKLREKYQQLPLVQKENVQEQLTQLVGGVPLLRESVVQRGRGRVSIERKRKG